MRIIAGSAGGLPITVPRTVLRPTTDRVREAVFSILGPHLAGATVLDLFAGSGSYGLEALSRGAASALFVDADHASAPAIQANLAKARLPGGSTASVSVETWLKPLPASPAYDLIFADPPFAKQKEDRDWNAYLLGHAHLPHHLHPDGLFILESFAKRGPVVPPGTPWQSVDERRYGDVLLAFYRCTHHAPLAGPIAI